MSYLVDTSALTRLRSAAVAQRLRALDAAGLARAAITDLEIGFSASNEREWDKLIAALGVFDPVEVVPDDFVRALALQRRLAKAGLKGRKVPDLLVAAVAGARSLTVLHYDADFDHIRAVTGQPTEWVVPSGTID
ncbi:MAG TPA: PIN domain-containing protein [Acidimicrobiales bacterium]|nr:PIN domain-containing protein [Acidimicrobiales bacterium]